MITQVTIVKFVFRPETNHLEQLEKAVENVKYDPFLPPFNGVAVSPKVYNEICAEIRRKCDNALMWPSGQSNCLKWCGVQIEKDPSIV